MQPRDPTQSEFPDDIAREEQAAVSTEFDADTGRRLKRGVAIAAAILLVGFVAVRAIRYFHERGIARAGEIAYGAPPPVDAAFICALPSITRHAMPSRAPQPAPSSITRARCARPVRACSCRRASASRCSRKLRS